MVRCGCRRGSRITPAHAGSTCSHGVEGAGTADHPRSRGEHTPRQAGGAAGAGSPPLTRGARRRWPWCRGGHRDHPRSRGEHRVRSAPVHDPSGSPPLTRGARGRRHRDVRPEGITPAHAGSTLSTSGVESRATDHPRSRGEHPGPDERPALTHGSPPLTRGALWPNSRIPRSEGITPAHAGSTCSVLGVYSATGDHPRSRGEHQDLALAATRWVGSPPLTRGARLAGVLGLGLDGITPAHAGSTRSRHPRPTRGRDHPRSRGEHFEEPLDFRVLTGSPPLTRGARVLVMRGRLQHGITPAHAGSTYS